MKTRRVFSTPDLPSARRAMAAARAAGVANDDISLIARSETEMEEIPESRKDVSTDFIPASLRGAGTGGALGLVAGLVAVAIPAMGVTIAGASLITLIGAAVGGWSAALTGSAFPNAVRRKFEEEIEQGKILVIIDDDQQRAAGVDQALVNSGAIQLAFNEPSALS